MNNFSSADFFAANPPGIREKLAAKHVFIAGAGGLGSNTANCLVRAGIGTLTIADFDTVSPSNLNRQFFFRDQTGMKKVEALKDNLIRINPSLNLNIISEKLSTDNFAGYIHADIDLILECFDRAEAKAELVRFALTERSATPIISVSGLAGLEACSKLRLTKGPGRLLIVGDNSSDADKDATLSSRVTAAAAIQAHTAIRILAGLKPE